MSEYLIQGETLTAIADAIREKTGGTDVLAPAAMAEAVAGIASGAKVARGFITPSEDGGYTIQHNLGVIPNFFVIFAVTSGTIDRRLNFFGVYDISSSCVSGMAKASYSTSTGTGKDSYTTIHDINACGSVSNSFHPYIPDVTETSITVNHDVFKLESGVNYVWIAGLAD